MMGEEWLKELEESIDDLSSTYTEWQYIVNVIYELNLFGCTNKKRAHEFAKHIFNKYRGEMWDSDTYKGDKK